MKNDMEMNSFCIPIQSSQRDFSRKRGSFQNLKPLSQPLLLGRKSFYFGILPPKLAFFIHKSGKKARANQKLNVTL